ncbi:MAG: aromatic amino acid ammonia-lyase [Caldilineaceae bacterium]
MNNFVTNSTVVVSDKNLTLEQINSVARWGAQVQVTTDREIISRMEASHEFIMRAVAEGDSIYGVTTAFGGMAHVMLSASEAEEIQNNAIHLFKCGAGKALPVCDVRAAMLLRIHSHLHGASGVRPELIKRLQLFLNAGMTPIVPELGSIGASGDIVPLAYICGAVMGLDEKYRVECNGEQIGAITALERLDLAPMRLRPKEGLAMFNGTSVMTGIAINCLYDAQQMFTLALGCHALFVQAFGGTNQSFHPFIHRLKPHTGQLAVANQMLHLLQGSQLSLDELENSDHRAENELIQDRYALRCIPQYLGPICEGLMQIARTLEIEANCANDNPLIDLDQQAAYHGGNFLGQYVSVNMDRLRYYLGLLAKHLDVQIGWLVSPEFNGGLPACLIGNPNRSVNMGLKGLQIVGNSIMPLLTFFGNSLADRFPSHAEQFNQNINSQGFGSANLTRQSIALFHQYMAICLIFGVQGVDLRTHRRQGHFDASVVLSPATKVLYDAVRLVTGVPVRQDRPFIWNDDEQFLDEYIADIAADIACDGHIVGAIKGATERSL